MKTRFIFCACSIVASFVLPAQTWQWAQAEGQIDSRHGGVASDNAGNVYQGGTAFGAGIVQGTIVSQPINGANNSSGFLIKRNSQGVVQWSKLFPGIAVTDIATASNGEIAMLANLRSTLTIGNQTLTPTNQCENILMKFDASGNFLWLQKFSNSAVGGANHITVDQTNGSIYVDYYSIGGIVSVGQSSYNVAVNATTYQSTGIFKFTSNGNYVWRYFASSMNYNLPCDIAVDANGDCMLVGVFSGTLDFSNNTQLSSAGSGDGLAIKVSAAGNLIWSKRVGGTAYDAIRSVSIDNAGNYLFFGDFSGSNFVVAGNTFSSANSSDIFILKSTAAGVDSWAMQLGNAQSAEFALNSVNYGGGTFFALAVTGPSITVGNVTYMFTTTQEPLVIIQIDNNGAILNSFLSNGSGTYANWSTNLMALDRGCGVYLASASCSLQAYNFGAISINSVTPGSTFIAHFNAGINQPSVSVAGSASVCAGSSLQLQASGATSYTWSTGATGNIINVPVYTNTFISVTATALGLPCPVQVIKSISAVPAPTVTVTASSTLVCAGTQVTLTAGGAQNYQWNNGSTSFSIVVTPTVSAPYNVIGSIANCSQATTVQIQTKAAPQMQITSFPNLVCAGESITLTVSGADTYTWTNGNSATTYVMAAANNTVLTVSGTNTLTNCIASLSKQISVNACTGLSEFATTSNAIVVYPNPANDALYIESTINTEIYIYDTSSKLILQSLVNGKLLVNLSSLPNGLYLLKTNATEKCTKLLVQH